MRKTNTAPSGELHLLTVNSTVLASNMLADAPTRRVDVYVPAGHDGAAFIDDQPVH